MTTKEAIQAQLDLLNDDELDDLHRLIEQFIRSRRKGDEPGLLEQLMEIKIDGPEDFSRNIDLYLTGKKRVEPNPH